MHSLEDESKVASDGRLQLDGALLIAVVALVGLGHVLIVVAGLLRTLLGVEVGHCVLQRLYAVQQHLADVVLLLQLLLLVFRAFKQTLQSLLQLLPPILLLPQRLHRLLIFFLISFSVLYIMRERTFEVVPALRTAQRRAVLVHSFLNIIIQIFGIKVITGRLAR